MKRLSLPDASEALPGRPEAMPVPEFHVISGRRMSPPWPSGLEQAMFGLGCFWGAERLFWRCDGVYLTAVGYAGGLTPNPTYQELCSGMTGHAEVVWLLFDPGVVSYEALLRLFWESHDPTQGMRQGNDIGTQYRSVIFTYGEMQQARAEVSRKVYQQALNQVRLGRITTQIEPAPRFYYAEPYHQQYLAKNPNGYCGLGGLGIHCPGIEQATI